MTLALLSAALPPDDVGAPERYAGSSAERREQALAAEAIARDRELVDSLLSADQEIAHQAFGHIMHTYTDRLVRFAYGFTGSADAAEDVVQDIFVRVWERRATLRPDESLRAYLFTSVRRAGLDVLKRRAVEEKHAVHLAPDVADDQLLSVDERMDAEAIAKRVRQALLRLPERRQTALRLRYEEQLPFGVVADVMGLSEKAAKHLVKRAVDEIRRHLGL